MEAEEAKPESTEPSHLNKFGKGLVGMVAAFVATALAEKAYDAIVSARQNRSTEE